MTTKTETRYTDAAQAVVAQQGEEISRLRLVNTMLLDALELAEATIIRLDRYAPGAQQGTLDVIHAARNNAREL